jgi:pimeloyl-ACP methyl ester carboxylesterase
MKRRLLTNDFKSSINALKAVYRRAPVEAELAAIACPTLVLSGEHDRAVVSARSERTAKQIPGAEFRIVPRAGHTSTVEEPGAVIAALESFYERVRAGAASQKS